MKRGHSRSILIDKPNTWHTTENSGVWEYGNYRSCYLVVQKIPNGKFKPMVGAWGFLETPDTPVPPIGYHEFDTLKQAQDFLYKYVDYVRDVRDDKEKKELQFKLHLLSPNVFFKP